MFMPELPPDAIRLLRNKATRERIASVRAPCCGIYVVSVGSMVLVVLAIAFFEGRALREVLGAVLRILVGCALLTAPFLLLFALLFGRLLDWLVVVRGELIGKHVYEVITPRLSSRYHVLQWTLRDSSAWRVRRDNTLGESTRPLEQIAVGRIKRLGQTTPEFDAAGVGQRVTAVCWSNGDLVGLIDPCG